MTIHELNHFVAGNTPKTVRKDTLIDGIKYSSRKRLNRTTLFKGNSLCRIADYERAMKRHPDANITTTMLYRTLQQTICLVYFNDTLEKVTRVHFNDDHIMVIERQSYFELMGA